MSITIIDVLATSAGVLTSVAFVYSLRRLAEALRARRALTQTMLATNRIEKLKSLIDDINSDPRTSEEAIFQVMKHAAALPKEEQRRVFEMLQSSIPARRAFVSKVLHDSVALKTTSAR